MAQTDADADDDLAVLRRAFDAWSRHDLAALGELLAPDARWRAVTDELGYCRDRTEILAVMKRNAAVSRRGRIEQMLREGDRIVVAFRPEQLPPDSERELEDGLAYQVVTMRDGRIVELKACAGRAAALSYATTGVSERLTVQRRPPLR